MLDLSLVTSEYGRNIHPCEGCVSSAMLLCYWPCSSYPNRALYYAHDWMAEIYERWVAAHAVTILAQTYWTQSPSPLKRMIDRLVAADGGNPDPTMTHSKRVAEAKAIEEKGWDYPKTWLAGFMASWCMATWQVPLPSSIATSAITARTTSWKKNTASTLCAYTSTP